MEVVAPGITHEQYVTGDVKPLDLFEGRTKDWILAFANELAQKKDSGIAVLILASSIIQPLGGVLPFKSKGARNNKADFCNGFVEIFPDVPGCKDVWQLAGTICDLLRNGLYHEAFIKPGLRLINASDVAISQESGEVVIDPVKFLQSVEATFLRVCADLRGADATAPLIIAFQEYWNRKDDEHGFRKATPVPQETVVAYGTSTLAPSQVTPMHASTLAPFPRGTLTKL